MKGYKRILFLFAVITTVIIILSRCMSVGSQLPKDIRGENYTGAATCIKCHVALSQSFAHNPHGLTSKPVNNQDLSRVFEPDSNTFSFNAHMRVVIEKRNKGIYQVAYENGKETHAERFDIQFGSGEKAFTYGYWKGKKLMELPLSYFTSINNWANSPSFPLDKIYYGRAITSRCFECHGSYVEKKTVQKSALALDEEMEKRSLIYGIDCERCHGPGKQHVVFHMENPKEKTAKFITIYKTLSRKQKMDACGVCHSGNDVLPQRSVFGFQPGDDLNAYYIRDFVSFGGANPDVHGNQTAMLTGSKCYQKSETMTCQSCHNTHESIKSSVQLYSQRCINCHKTTTHSALTLAKGILKDNCIDCHMPKQPSKLISFQKAGQNQVSPYLLRSHHIGIYPVK
ncbi:hypothetical protein [Pedobacter punctiformis]|uniref:Cytochrome c-552/4 domain-containing protein n=1 Tax=Pedobacter punctiformis TaxID=3004097 RepID=A0ABT4LBN5_9SPHI|nr:hypothetical protein [Pedobacter sp. HCMS5-2]MCZ4245314.1 hypothetical protein [Pedobacter sp. HCMS5-2]